MGSVNWKEVRKRFRDERSLSYPPRRITLAAAGFLAGMGLSVAVYLHAYFFTPVSIDAYPLPWIYWAYLFPVIIGAMGYTIGHYAERAAAGTREIEKLQEKLRFSDRTEKLLDKRTRELKTAKQELDRFFALSADLLAIADAEGYLQRINPAFTTTLEFPEEKLLGQPLLELVHEGDRPEVQVKIRDFKRDTAPVFFECRCLCRSGGYRWLFWAAQPTIDGVVYLIGRDVTEQKRTQIQLQALAAEVEQQAQMLDQILSSFPDRVYLNDRSGRFQYVSESGAKAWGMTKADMIGKTWLEIGLPPEIMKPLEVTREQVFVTGRRHTSEFSFSEAGEIRHFEYIMTPIRDDKDKVQAVVTTVRDITERRRNEMALRNSEARLFKFLENIPMGILVVDGDGNPCYLNKAAQETLDIPPGTNLQSNTLAETLRLYVAGTDRVYPNDELPVLRALIRRKTVQAADVELCQPNRRIPLEIQASPVFNGDGRVEYAVATFQDITARRQAEALALLRAREEEREKILRTVQEGLFIIDREGNIGSQYSAALETILEETALAGRNLGDYLRPRLPERLLNSTMDYLTLMFDPTLKEKLIRDVNPLQEVELFFENEDGQYRSKFLSFQFRRIMENGEITGLLVSVTDVTRRVQLARQLEAAEARAKKQMELLLGIIHIEPAMMADFLESVDKELTRINRELKHPAADRSHLQARLDNIFCAMHTIKGNASLIGFKLFEKLAHEFEDSIVALRERQSLTGKDFLPLVTHLRQMFEHLDRIKEVMEMMARYGVSFRSRRSEEWHIILKYLRNLTTALGKPDGKVVHLDTRAFHPLVIPTRYQKVIKDVLVQLTRNALVHGIETPEERKARGKPPQGTITIASEFKPRQLVIRFRDDGRGISPMVTDRGTGRTEDTGSGNPGNCYPSAEILFLPGVTTMQETTPDGGRGVGLTLVKQRVEEAGGTVEVFSRPGQFCEFRLIFPLPEEDSAEGTDATQPRHKKR